MHVLILWKSNVCMFAYHNKVDAQNISKDIVLDTSQHKTANANTIYTIKPQDRDAYNILGIAKICMLAYGKTFMYKEMEFELKNRMKLSEMRHLIDKSWGFVSPLHGVSFSC